MRRGFFIAFIVAIMIFFYLVVIDTGPVSSFYTDYIDTFAEGLAENKEQESNGSDSEKNDGPDLATVRLITTGNIMAAETQINQAKIGDDKYDFSPSFKFIAPYLREADLVVGDLEVAQAGPDIWYAGFSGYSGWPLFNSPGELSEALYNAGINIFTLANNHALDRGFEGLMSTISHIRSTGAKTFGAYKSQEERDEIFIIEKNGIYVAFIGYTYGVNGNPIPEGSEFCVNFAPDFLDISPVIKDIQAAREQGADIVAVFTHWGEEHTHEPQPQRLRQVAAELAVAGADLIIGGHPKWIQPFEWFFNQTEDGLERSSLAVYSQGSFLTHQYEGDGHNASYSEFSLLLDLELTKNLATNKTAITDVNYEIAWTHRQWRYRVLLLTEIFAAGSPELYHLNHSAVERLRNIYNISIEVVERYGHPEDMTRALTNAEKLIQYNTGENST